MEHKIQFSTLNFQLYYGYNQRIKWTHAEIR